MANIYRDKIISRIIENTDTSSSLGIIIASPSQVPPYKYHWIRDAALVMRTFIDLYRTTNDSIYYQYIINYIENETKIQKLKTLGGLGEPKVNTDCSPFNGDWGRPQNDGPALRGIIMLKIIDLFKYKYDNLIETLIVPIILKDIQYTLDNYDKVCFDIWEENIGWHFYTRMVQLKFIKDCITEFKVLMFDDNLKKRIMDVYNELKDNIKNHINSDTIISSFNVDGDIIKYEDAANILAFCHIDYDVEILKVIPLHFVEHTCNELLSFFRMKYKDPELNLIGRYKNDQYYDGQIWIICSLALAQVFLEFYKTKNIVNKRSPMNRARSNPNNDYIIIANEILERILSLDSNFILPEQFNPITNKYYSASKLTWNYSELYILYNQLK